MDTLWISFSCLELKKFCHVSSKKIKLKVKDTAKN